MNDLWRDFYNWIDRVAIDDLVAARDKAVATKAEILDRQLRADLNRMIRLIDTEIVTRSAFAEALQMHTEPRAQLRAVA